MTLLMPPHLVNRACPTFAPGDSRETVWPPSSSSSEDNMKSPLSAFFNPAPLLNSDGRQLASCRLQSPMSAYFNPGRKAAHFAESNSSSSGDSNNNLPQYGLRKHTRLGGAHWQDRAEERFAKRLEQYRASLEDRAASGPSKPGRTTRREDWGEDVPLLPGASSEQPMHMVPSPQVQGWRVPQRYQLGSLLGTGAYGSVCEAWDHKDGRRVAVKRIAGVFQSAAFCKRILREVAILSHLRHEHVVRIIDLPKPGTKRFEVLHIVMERCDTDLRKVCAHPQGVTLPQARKLAYGLLLGCRYLHSAGIYHRDLKPANCLVNWDCHVKICDFNLARTVVDDGQYCTPSSTECSEEEKAGGEQKRQPPSLKRTLTAHVASRWYRPPEVILQLPYSGAMDVWSAGCIIAELFLALNEGGRQPRQGALFPGRECYAFSHDARGDMTADVAADPGDQLDVIFNVLGTPSARELEGIPSPAARAHVGSYVARPGLGLRTLIPAEAGKEGAALLESMLPLLPGDRSSLAEALKHPFFARVRKHADQDMGVAPGRVDIGFDEAELEQTVSMIPHRLKNEIDRFQPPCSPQSY